MRAYLFATIALMTACSDNRDDPVELLDTIAEAYCAHLESCAVAAPDYIYNGCTQTRRSDQGAATLREDLDRGVAVFSHAAAERCLQAIASDTCPIAPGIGTPDFPGAIFINWDLDDVGACHDVLGYRNLGL